MKRTSSNFNLIITIVFVLVVIPGVSGEPGSPERLPADQEKVTQQEVSVVYQLTDMIVRDREGRFVHGLGPDDFVLLVDKKETEIKSVDEFTAPPSKVEKAKQYKVTGDTSEDAAEASEPNVQPRFIVILFDRFNLGVKGMKEAKATAKRIVTDVLAPSDSVAVFQYNRSLRILCEPTNDEAQVLAAIDSAGGANLNTNYRPQRIEVYPPRTMSDGAQLRMLLMQKTAELRNYVDSISVLTKALKKMPGRKSVLLFSEGPNVHNPVSMEDIAAWRANFAGQRQAAMEMAQTGRDNTRDDQSGQQNPQSELGDDEQIVVTPRLDPTAFEELVGYLTPQFVSEQLDELSRQLNSVNTTVYTIRRGNIQAEWMMGVDMDMTGMGDEGFLTEEALRKGRQNRHQTPGEGGYTDFRFPGKSVTGELNSMEGERLGVLRDAARMTSGKFFDAGVSMSDLLDALQGETSEYYLVGFIPPERGTGRYIKLQIKPKNPEYKVIYRTGFFAEKSFAQMDANEKAIHLEESFLIPGILNDLKMSVGAFWLPMSGNPVALLSFSINSGILEKTPDGKHELEMAINVVDLKGRIRYRDHKILHSGSAPEELEEYWLNSAIPLTKEPCILYIALRDNHTGGRSAWKVAFAGDKSSEGEPIVATPILMSPPQDGDLSAWRTVVIRDGVKISDPLSAVGMRFPGKPVLDHTVTQGLSTNVVIAVGNLGAGFDPNAAGVSVDYAVFDKAGTGYRLTADDQRVSYLASGNLLIIMASVPVGLAPEPKGEMRVAISGLPGEARRILTVPYRLDPFNQDDVELLIYDPRIEPLQ